jgi:hypothetical protein
MLKSAKYGPRFEPVNSGLQNDYVAPLSATFLFQQSVMSLPLSEQ